MVGDQTSVERRYFISSLTGGDAKQMAEAIRGHWGIENELHWTLDVAFREDDCRVRVGYAAQNFSLLRQLALSLLKRESSAKVGVKNKRLNPTLDGRRRPRRRHRSASARRSAHGPHDPDHSDDARHHELQCLY